MSQAIEVKVPDIGDFTDIPVIEVLVKAGDTVEKEQSLVTLESDKATMDVPSSAAGIGQGSEGQGGRQRIGRLVDRRAGRRRERRRCCSGEGRAAQGARSRSAPRRRLRRRRPPAAARSK